MTRMIKIVAVRPGTIRSITSRKRPVEPAAEERRGHRCTELDRMLFNGAMRGNMEMVTGALRLGATVDGRDTNDATPFMWACANGHLRIAELLLVKGAEINTRDMFGRTALDFAEGECKPHIISMLKARGGKSGMDFF